MSTLPLLSPRWAVVFRNSDRLESFPISQGVGVDVINRLLFVKRQDLIRPGSALLARGHKGVVVRRLIQNSSPGNRSARRETLVNVVVVVNRQSHLLQMIAALDPARRFTG